jgi:hypothetical protein
MKLSKEVVEKIANMHEEFINKHSDNDEHYSFDEKQFNKMINFFSDPIRVELFTTINNMSQEEKDELMALMYFGRDADSKSVEDFEIIRKKIRHEGDYDTDHILAKAPLATYLRSALDKLNM